MRRTFIWTEDQRDGSFGFAPAWVAGFDPVYEIGMAHDILEHRISDTGEWHQELMAFGAMQYIRGENGFFGSRFDAPDLLGKELAELWEGASNPNCIAVPKGMMPRADLEDSTKYALIRVREAFLEEASNEYDADEGERENILAHSLDWLKRGYIMARARYERFGSGSPCQTFEIMDQMTRKLYSRLDEESCIERQTRLHVEVDLYQCRVRMRTTGHYYRDSAVHLDSFRD